jgi:hypothetical protein
MRRCLRGPAPRAERATAARRRYWDLLIVILVIVNAWAIPVDVANYFGAFDDDSETSLVRTPPQSQCRCGQGSPQSHYIRGRGAFSFVQRPHPTHPLSPPMCVLARMQACARGPCALRDQGGTAW